MDRLHLTLLGLLGISIVFLGIVAIQGSPVVKIDDVTKDPSETWSVKITPDHLNNIADGEWVGRLRLISESNITGSDLICLNICGNRCLWLGYTYKNHTVEQGTYLWGDKENAICSCSCYVKKYMLNS